MYEWEDIHLDDVAEALLSRDPRRYPFGYSAKRDTDSSWVRSLFWFSSTEELASFLIFYEPEFCEDADERRDARNALKLLLRDSRGNVELSEDIRERLNLALEPHLEIVWWGPFEDLCMGEGNFARSVLQSFRELYPAPVAPDEIKEFVDFLSELT